MYIIVLVYEVCIICVTIAYNLNDFMQAHDSKLDLSSVLGKLQER